MNRLLNILGVASAIIVSILLIQRLAGGGVAPTPEVFQGRTSLEAAITEAAKSDKIVLAFATADWCPPCQQMKRTLLVEPSLVAQISRDFLPVYVDIDKDTAAAERLAAFSVPSTVILKDGKQVARMEGLIPHDAYAQWLTAAHDLARSPTPFVERASDEFLKNIEKNVQAAENTPPAQPTNPR
ncbi:MAG TPA: thioredoxin family protein [Phycisphaerales bacterium]